MKKLYALAVLLIGFGVTANAQAFRKGSLLVSVTEGSTFANYGTTNTNDGANDVIGQNTNGTRDPLFVEYGLSKRWSIGLSMGTDLFNVNPATFYGFSVTDNVVKSQLSEVAIDGDYHFLVTRKFDVAAFTSLGLSSVSFKGNDGDRSYNYTAGGLIARTGVKARYYFFRRFGATCMASVFAANCSTDGVNGNTAGEGYSTSVKGAAIEFGLCYRIIH